MTEVKKALKNLNVRSKVTLGLVLGVVLLAIDSLTAYLGQPIPDVVYRIGQVVVLIIITLGLSDAANLEKKHILDKVKEFMVTAPFWGSVIELVNVVLNNLPDFGPMLPPGLYNGLHALAAALIALGLRQKIGEARLNAKPIDPKLLEQAKYAVFKQ